MPLTHLMKQKRSPHIFRISFYVVKRFDEQKPFPIFHFQPDCNCVSKRFDLIIDQSVIVFKPFF